MKKVFFLIAGLCVLTACNTVHGIGKDIERGGEAIQKAVK
ncbi:MAG: entericidin A/B family lipoprotein [Proteobacteria bacterium]|nr:entericidin A/B family lipoprotein [Pseudomonadota bacterium]HQR04947.1 entericidin A/B family lipoprotein [Rhodocyclaceae bacterium]